MAVLHSFPVLSSTLDILPLHEFVAGFYLDYLPLHEFVAGFYLDYLDAPTKM